MVIAMNNQLSAFLRPGAKLSPEDENALNQFLSTQTISGNGDMNMIGDQNQLASMLQKNAQPEQPPMNQMRNNLTGATYQFQPKSGSSDPWMSGAQVIDERLLPDGRILRRERVPAMDGFGRQSSDVVERIITPDHLNPEKAKQLQFDKSRSDLLNSQVTTAGNMGLEIDPQAANQMMNGLMSSVQNATKQSMPDMGGMLKSLQSSDPSKLMGMFSKQMGGNSGVSLPNLGGMFRPKSTQSAPSGYRYTPDGNMEPVPGGPADLKAQSLAQQRATGTADVDIAIGSLRDAYDRIEKGGGITSTAKGPIDNAAASISSSSGGQGLGKLFGTENQSARNDIAMTRPALLAAIMKATGMSAKQMDSNAELKLWLSTATDPTLDVESNRRALNKIEQKYLGTGGSVGSGASGSWDDPDKEARYQAWKKSRGM